MCIFTDICDAIKELNKFLDKAKVYVSPYAFIEYVKSVLERDFYKITIEEACRELYPDTGSCRLVEDLLPIEKIPVTTQTFLIPVIAFYNEKKELLVRIGALKFDSEKKVPTFKEYYSVVKAKDVNWVPLFSTRRKLLYYYPSDTLVILPKPSSLTVLKLIPMKENSS